MSMLNKLKQQRAQVQQEQTDEGKVFTYTSSAVDRIHQPGFDVNTITPLPGTILIKVNIDDIQDAPEEWNFFRKQSQDKIMSLAVSLKMDGQLSPIILREVNQEKRWECLAGHTRRIAAAYLRDNGEEEYQFLYAFAYPFGVCSDKKAKDIIVFSNTEGRESLSSVEKYKSFVYYYLNEQNSNRNQKAGELIEKFKQKYDIKRSQVYNYISLNEKLILDFQHLFEQGIITQQNAIALTRMDKQWQQWVLDTYPDRLSKETIPKIIGKSIDEVKAIFSSLSEDSNKYLEPDFFKKVPGGLLARVFVPEGSEKDFEELLSKFYAEKGV